MEATESRYLEAFAAWLEGLAGDAIALAAALEAEAAPEAVRRPCAVALSYLFKSVDLIPDGIEDLGFLDDACVFRVVAADAVEAELTGLGTGGDGVLARLAADAELVRGFLGADYGRLLAFTRTLDALSVRGRTVDEVLRDPAARAALAGEVRGWAGSYRPPAFTPDPKNLIKLRAFFSARLPT